MVDIGSFIWVEDDVYSWLPGKVTGIVDDNYNVLVDIDGEQFSKLVPRNNTFSEVHPSCLRGVDDLLMLGDFNQQTLLHNTRTRFAQDKIYSFIGTPILIAVNPYKTMPIYSTQKMHSFKNYFNKLKSDPTHIGPPEPHLYHLAEAAYCDMILDHKNQSLIICGESGSGKTESTKIILKYLATASLDSCKGEKEQNDKNNVKNSKNNIFVCSSNKNNENISVEKQVLDSNPLLEAFGNAKTVKNNNSSRFGKFIQVSFSEQGKILCAKIYNYLLEKSRVVRLQKGERNYHIFYQLLLGADEKEKIDYKIKEPLYFKYLCYSNGENTEEDYLNVTDDAADFKVTKECMNKLTFSDHEIKYIFSILMGILYLGNIEFDEAEINNAECVNISESCREDFENAAYFLGIEKDTLLSILTENTFTDMLSKKKIKRKLNITKANDCRDAIAKALYSKMFDFIVNKINKAISNKEEASKVVKGKIHKIGLLDIFGFENFDNNSFEQLCINYANERLQQYFNNHIFKLEQETYKKEGIDWTQIEFIDNKNIIDLIDNGKISIFGLLDSEGITPNSSDIKFKKNVYQLLKNNEALGEIDENLNKICVYHFAGVIEYDVDGFVEKNLDQVTEDITSALEQSKNKLIKKIFEKKEDSSKGKTGKVVKTSGKGPNKLQSDTLSKQFKTQLDELLKMLSESNPRYVKCIKPNCEKKPGILDSIDVMDQLLCAGVLEAIKIRKQGYNIRRTKEEFYKQYNIITPDIDIHKLSGGYNEAVLKMLDVFMKMPEMTQICKGKKKMIQVGKTLIFMKEEVKAILDFKLNRIKYIYLIQSVFRGFRVRKKVRAKLNAVRKIQGAFKGKLLRDFYKVLKKKAKKVQKNWRHWRLYHRVMKLIKQLEENKKKKLMEEMEKKKQEGGKVEDIQREIDNINMSAKKREEENNEINNRNALLGRSFNSESKMKNKVKRKKTQKEGNKSSKKISSEDVENIGYNEAFLENELKKTIQDLQLELEEVKIERDKLKVNLENTSNELKELQNNQLNNTVEENQKQDELIKKLKKSLNEKDTTIDVLNIQLEDLNKGKKDLSDYVDNLKIQLQKRKEKFDKETQSLYQRIQELEIAKNEYERRLKNDTKEERDSQRMFNLNPSIKAIDSYKKENKELQEKLEELKLKSNKTIKDLRKQLVEKEYQIKSNEASSSAEEFKKLKKENSNYKQRIAQLEKNIEQMNKDNNMESKKKTLLKEKENECKILKEENEEIKLTMEKMNAINMTLKKQINEKGSEIEKYKKLNQEQVNENEKLNDENMQLKKEYNLMKTKVNVGNADMLNKKDATLIKTQLQLKELQKKSRDDEAKIESLEAALKKKKLILESKKKMNLLLIDLAKIKRSEVDCIENINLTKSEKLKDALVNLKAREGTLLSQLAEITKEDQEIDDSEDEENEEEDEEEENEEES